MVKVYLPELGEGVAKATVSYWYVEEGATVTEGSELVEVSTDKATFNVPAPCSGNVIEIVAHEGDVVEIGAVLAVIEEDTVSESEEEAEGA
ncbi:dihydrolipoamide succinyltransferase component (E2) of 2-oxoglutarate dehydrogenase complex [Candidatus Velamenicoccus archaeovorus]|uniref:Dihydrolipoamide succinyltransferase component (E2) of 2-oxoglutarate dehydrogenase complex n=1 Tax=Velamenicoccus archaeovorus TaxID=1930593 RepID=A0A410P3Y5_VELA1|nr:biotin/lipoyl-containing protein [Candidatus Velamenicoccus archaeovorus]QAT16822.1 dihydrolipoamide succinyltransferase component (E2) of 2-oxoglutarate dehydrogenase complex [Candidatus Velamenicoccus archaeovorus]